MTATAISVSEGVATVLRRRPTRYAIAIALYSVVLAFFFSGIVTHPGSRLLGPYSLGDAAEAVRTYDVAAAAGKSPWTFRYDALNGAPEGSRLLTQIHYAQPFQPAFVWGLRPFVGSTAALNLFVLAGILLTAVAGFALLEWAGLGLVASLFGGFAVAFNPYIVERAMLGHVTFLHGWVLILLFGTLVQLRLSRTWRWAVAAGGAYASCFLVAAYMGLLGSGIVLAFAILEIVTRRQEWTRTIGLGAVVLAVAIAGQLPGGVSYALDRGTLATGLAHDVKTLADYAAVPLDYVMPVPRSPVFGRLGEAIGRSPAPEHRLFTGFALLLLAALTVVQLVRRRVRLPGPRAGALTALAVAVVPVALALSFGRELRLFGVGIPMPAFPLTELTTFYRVYARFGYVVEMGLVVLASVAVLGLLGRGRPGALLATALMTLTFVEFLPGHVNTVAVDRLPAHDVWLAQQARGIVAHYPLRVASEEAYVMGFREFYFQRFDGLPHFEIYSAALVSLRTAALRLQAARLDDETTPGILAAERVRYVVVHDDVYRAQGDAPPVAQSGLRFSRRFGPVRIYRVVAAPIDVDRYLEERASQVADQFGLPRPAVSIGDGFYEAEVYPGFSPRFHWMTGAGEIIIDNGDTVPVSIWLDGFGFANAVARRLELVDAAGRTVAGVDVPASMTELRLGPFEVPTGRSTWTLRAVPGAAPLGGSDPRRASVYLSELVAARKPDLSETLRKSG